MRDQPRTDPAVNHSTASRSRGLFPLALTTIAIALVLCVVVLTLNGVFWIATLLLAFLGAVAYGFRSNRWFGVYAVIIAGALVFSAEAIEARRFSDSCSPDGGAVSSTTEWSLPHLAIACTRTYPDGTTKTTYMR